MTKRKCDDAAVRIPIIENGKVVGHRIEHSPEYEGECVREVLCFKKESRGRTTAEMDVNGTHGFKPNPTRGRKSNIRVDSAWL